MGRFTWTAVMKPPGRVDRLWYWWIKENPPLAEATQAPRTARWARLVPMWVRPFHWCYARLHSLHWGPCVLCMAPYGGHQSAGGVPDPTQPPEDPERGPWFYVGICPRCTRSGKSVRS